MAFNSIIIVKLYLCEKNNVHYVSVYESEIKEYIDLIYQSVMTLNNDAHTYI